MRKIIILILILFPNKSFADQGLEISCLNLKSEVLLKFKKLAPEPLNKLSFNEIKNFHRVLLPELFGP